MNISPAFVAAPEPTVAFKPGQRAFHHPPVSAEPGARLNAPSGNPGLNAALFEGTVTAGIVVAFVSVELGRSFSWTAPRLEDSGNCINQGFEHFGIVDISRSMADSEGNTLGIDHQVAFGAGFPAIGRIRASILAPPGAGTLPESRQARDQSI